MLMTDDFFRNRLDQLIDLRHPLAVLANRMPWQEIEASLAHRPDSKTVMAQLKDWFDDYNSYNPHSALGYLPPTLFREKRSVT
jgi:transposase InsO family protein